MQVFQHGRTNGATGGTRRLPLASCINTMRRARIFFLSSKLSHCSS